MVGSLRSAVRVVSAAYSTHGVVGLMTAGRYYAERFAGYVAAPGRQCPLCGWSGRDFRPIMLLADRYVRPSVMCPNCGSWERHRAWGPALRALLAETLRGRRVDIVHFSPERCIASELHPHAASYIGSNLLYPQPGELRLDLHALDLPDESADLAVMSYVLSCLPRDVEASEELWRVLRPGGMVIACEPFAGDRHEEWGIAGHGDQYRAYGLSDVGARFAPFDVEVRNLTAALSASARERYGVTHPEYMLVLRKRD